MTYCEILQQIKEALNELALNVGTASNAEVIEKLEQLSAQINEYQIENC